MADTGQQDPFAGRDQFEDDVFTDVELAQGDVSGKEFIRCRFERGRFEASRWQGAHLEDCVFDGCDLARMQPAALRVRGVEFHNCRLTGVDWSEISANPTVTFVGCNLQYASFVRVNLTGTHFTRCRLIEVNFVESRLVDAVFAESDLSGSRFDHCDLRKADFSQALGLLLDPGRNTVKGARINLAAAVSLAAAAGLKVSGFDDDTDRRQ